MKNIVSINTLNSQFGIQSTMGIGTVYASLYNVQFGGCNRFEGNWGTAVYVVNGVVNFQNSSVHFINNTGVQGGALALIGSSVMIVGQNNYSFRALYEGGALYVSLTDSTDSVTSRSCFIQYTDDRVLSSMRNANITFMGNTAKKIHRWACHLCNIYSPLPGCQQ